ncbi:MAG: hypothetical protein JNJ88_19500 [Planctomycetes bacterium]|nr:hypothetical protein [Planctomycetota bacterium]
MLPITAPSIVTLFLTAWLLSDRVELRSGGVVEGSVVSESEHAVLVEVARGARIEIARKDVVAVHRAPKAESAPAAESASPAPTPCTVPLREHFYWVRNARHERLGTRRVAIGPDPQTPERIRIEETVDLREAGGPSVKITRIEVADSELRPLECQYREVFDGAASTVRAMVGPKGLEVECLDGALRRKELIPFPAGATFPLLAAEAQRRASAAPGESRTWVVFDPFVRTVTSRKIASEPARTLALGGAPPASYRVQIATVRSVESLAWLDAEGFAVQEELNGPDLVAHRCAAGDLETSEPKGASATAVADASGRVRFVVANSDWSVERTSGEALSLERCDFSGRLVACAAETEREVTADGAAVSIERRLRGSLELYERTGGFQEMRIGTLPAARFEFRCAEGSKERGGTAVVVKGAEVAWAFVMTFEPSERARAERELERLLQRADLRL